MMSISSMLWDTFLRMSSYLSQLKVTWISFSISLLSQFFKIFISPWRFYHLLLLSYEMAISIYLVYIFILFVKRGYALFVFASILEYLDILFLNSIWKNLCLFFSFLSISSLSTFNIFKMSLEIRCLIFVNHPDYLLATSSLKALVKLQSSFTEGLLKHWYFKVNMGKKVEVSLS